MIDKTYIEKFLDINQPMEDSPTRFSTLALLIKGARNLSGRDPITGIYEMNEINEKNFNNQTYHPFQFTGLICYLILLEQIGSIFKPKTYTSTRKKNGIICALTHFSDLGQKEKKLVKALRDSLIHKFGLATEKNRRDGNTAKFSLSIERNIKVIKIPSSDWNGDFSDKSENTTTTVYLFDLIDLIEKIYEKIKDENKRGNIELILEDNIDELKSRYTIVY